MADVIFAQATVDRNENCIALCRRDDTGEGDENNGAIFCFSDENACNVAIEICDALAENEYGDDNIDAGEIGNAPCLFLLDSTSNDAKFFIFDNERDLATACQMATHFIELGEDADDETTDGEE